MGCTQSKATNEAVIVNNNVVKEIAAAPSKTESTPVPVQQEQPDLTTSQTVSSDDHDAAVPVVDDQKTEGVAPNMETETVSILENTNTTTPNVDEKKDIISVSEEIGNTTAGPTTVVPPVETTDDAVEISTTPRKCPRSPRRRSHSTGVSEMAGLVEKLEGTQNPIFLMPPVLQPVSPKKAEQQVAVVEVADDEIKEIIPPTVESIDPVAMDASVEEKGGASPDGSKENIVEAEDTPKDEIKQEVVEEQPEAALPTSAKYCAGCFLEETASGDFKVCAKCKAVRYCGKMCQKQHWKLHKKVCCMSTLDMSSSQLQESELLCDSSPTKSASSLDRSGDLIELDASMRKADIHDDAVRELEAVLRRLRSEEAMDEAETPTVPEGTDPVEAAREAILDEAITNMLDSALFDKDAPESPSYETNLDENSPVLQAPRIVACAGCNSTEKTKGSFKSCAKCREVFYCSKGCQKGHMKQHKKVCCKAVPKRSSLLQANHANPIQASS